MNHSASQTYAATGSTPKTTSLSVSEQVAHLAKFNIDTSQRGSAGKVNTLMITDPDGNHIAFAEAIDPSVAQSLQIAAEHEPSWRIVRNFLDPNENLRPRSLQRLLKTGKRRASLSTEP